MTNMLYLDVCAAIYGSICKTKKVLAKLTCPKIKISVSFDPMKKPSLGFVPFIERSISIEEIKN